jgi:Protein of unknown function (DUF4232)
MIAPPKPPEHDELEALIKEARARQLRRRLLGAAGVAIVAALGLTAYALAIGRGGHAKQTGGSASGGPPLCRSTQLSTSAGVTAAGGTVFDPVTLANTSSHACSLPAGIPHLHVVFRGKVFPIKQVPWRFGLSGFGTPAGHVLKPGRKAFVEVSWRDFCPHPAAAPQTGSVTMALRFADGLRTTALQIQPDLSGPSLPGCGEVIRPPQAVGVTRFLRYR